MSGPMHAEQQVRSVKGEGRDGAAPSLDPTRCPECGQMGQWRKYLDDLPFPNFVCWPCWRMWEDVR